MNRAIRLKFGRDLDDGTLLLVDHKKTLSGRGLDHVTQFRNNGTSIITVERIELSASKLVQTYRTHASFLWTIKRPLMHGRALGHLTEFRNFGTLNF